MSYAVYKMSAIFSQPQCVRFVWMDVGTVKPVYNDHLMGHLDELQKADIVNKSKLVPSVFIQIHYWINHRQ